MSLGEPHPPLKAGRVHWFAQGNAKTNFIKTLFKKEKKKKFYIKKNDSELEPLIKTKKQKKNTNVSMYKALAFK